MRKITLTLLALMVYAAAYCGVPQAISYQAVALNGAGQPVKNKNVALRLSIIYGSSGGTLNYQERQTALTDASGVLSVNIGNGSVLSGSFAGVDWSKGVYFLKTEIDTTGGTSYTTIGTVQFFSVPFSLYSGNSAQANLGSYEFPDGLNNIVPVNLSGSFSYLVPAGQTLYITDVTYNQNTSCSGYGVTINGVELSPSAAAGIGGASASANKVNYPIGIPSGYAVNGATCGTSLQGFTIPTNNPWVVFDLSLGNYTVPAGKVLVVKNMISNAAATWNGAYTVGSNTSTYTKTVNFVDQGQTISTSGLTGSLLMVGFLKNR